MAMKSFLKQISIRMLGLNPLLGGGMILFFLKKNGILDDYIKYKTDKNGAALIAGCDGHGNGGH